LCNNIQWRSYSTKFRRLREAASAKASKEAQSSKDWVVSHRQLAAVTGNNFFLFPQIAQIIAEIVDLPSPFICAISGRN
jgi:hypothetical protein